ncbi:N-formylglutamate amidohydrolase [Acetobacteraceae bacterium KSS8]|uniref:N-formylglutamate amidohydrolase n=1 Tax=Endosaccharibacter trunci TaxID=2812733 RepID=A0ABT1W6I8_9PROT|nr:N-formylglutamate amidohydrolase [Acetobacteraceae bacterium KSS8]
MTTLLQPAETDFSDLQLRVIHPETQTVPLVVASPHSGRNYSSAFVAASRLDAHTLRRSEDCLVDELLAGAASGGFPLLIADFPRAFCDVNREQWELDPAMFADTLPDWCNTRTARVCAGFGTIARQVASGQPIYNGKLLFADAEDRIRTCWEPYHAHLAALLRQTEDRFGVAVLVDCHSMPAEDTLNRHEPDFVLGDAHGSACHPLLTRTAHEFLEQNGYSVRRNDPYAGGYVTRFYGRPRLNRHALQIEISRRLYLDQQTYRKRHGFEAVRHTLDGLLRTLGEAAGTLPVT